MQQMTALGIVAGMAAPKRPRSRAQKRPIKRARSPLIERARLALKAIMKSRDLSAAAWEDKTKKGKAGLGSGVLSKFIRGTTSDIGLSALLRLAEAEHLSIAQLVGEADVQAAQPSAVDMDLLAKVIAKVEEQRDGKAIDARTRALAIATLYDAARSGGSDDLLADLAANLLRMARH